MLQSKNWGPITWNLLHTIIDKCQLNENFDSYKDKLIYIIKGLCIFVPCNVSSYNSNIFFEKFPFDKIKNIQDLKKQIYLLHNFINTKTHKPLFNYSMMTCYNNMNIINIFNIFVYFYINNIHIKKTQNYHRVISLIKDIKYFLNIYIIPYFTKNEFKKEEEVIQKEEEVIQKEEEVIQKEEEVVEVEEVVVEEVVVEEVVVEEVVEEVVKKPRLININLLTRTNKKIFSRDIYSNISIIDDNFLPSIELNLPEAILEMKKNEKCLPLDAYIERWNRLKSLKNTKQNKKNTQKTAQVDDALLPPLNLTLPLAINKIKTSPKCVPFDLYIKRWNELKTQETYKKKHTTLNKK
jgi:hypothetical protein